MSGNVIDRVFLARLAGTAVFAADDDRTLPTAVIGRRLAGRATGQDAGE